MAKRIALTDLAEALQGDGRATVAAQVRARLKDLAAGLDARLEGGLSPDEFARTRKIRAAINAAGNIIEACMKSERS